MIVESTAVCLATIHNLDCLAALHNYIGVHSKFELLATNYTKYSVGIQSHTCCALNLLDETL